jgi:hypothetical protein
LSEQSAHSISPVQAFASLRHFTARTDDISIDATVVEAHLLVTALASREQPGVELAHPGFHERERLKHYKAVGRWSLRFAEDKMDVKHGASLKAKHAGRKVRQAGP